MEVTSRRRTQIENAILARLAGVRAEKLFTGRWNYSSKTDDYSTAYELARHIAKSEDAVAAYFAWMEIWCTDLVSHSLMWYKIQTVAAELVRRHRLTGDEAQKVIVLSR